VAPSDGGGAIESPALAEEGVPPSDVPAPLTLESEAVRLFEGSEAGTTLAPVLAVVSESEGATTGAEALATVNVAMLVVGATVVMVVLVDVVATWGAGVLGAETTVCSTGLTTVSVSTTGATWLAEVSEEDWIVGAEDGELIVLVEELGAAVSGLAVGVG
jgi:hypothetical protein